MEFELLGPLRVVAGGRDVTPARPKQRALLAMLLLHREQVVPGTRLIEALWGEEPPGTAQNALHGHVSTLRKLIGPDRIRTRPPGYLLHVSEDSSMAPRLLPAHASRAPRLTPRRPSRIIRHSADDWEVVQW